VWNYEHTTAMLFGDLAWTMREVELAYNTDDHGLMGFRAMLPLGRPVAAMAAADGQMGCVMKLYREWRLSGDDEALRRLWPAARRALEFAWRPGGWDPDRDGVMEGCQHNTMDVEYFGPNPEIGVWYLGALRAAEKMASHLGEDEFADTCHELYESGRQYFDGSLFNGEYYEHEIRLPARGGKISKGLQLGMGDDSRRNPRWQVGPGCQTDQLVGQLMAHVCGLGYLLKPTHVRKALRSIMKHNWRGELYGHFNHARSYALNEEAGLIVCTWPRGGRPEHPFPYAMEVWPGLEYTAAGHMLYEGQDRPAVKIVDAVRDRFDGAKRNPFNEPECGWHYARSMAAWATLLGYTGFQYSASDKSIAFRAANEPATWFWSTGHAWGTVRQKPGKQSTTVTFDVLHGKLTLKRLEITGVGDRTFGRRRVVRPGKPLRVKIGQ